MGRERRLIAEPFVNPNTGDKIAFYEQPVGTGNMVVDQNDSSCTIYDREEILKLGYGNYAAGIQKLGQVFYALEELRAGQFRPLHFEINEM